MHQLNPYKYAVKMVRQRTVIGVVVVDTVENGKVAFKVSSKCMEFWQIVPKQLFGCYLRGFGQSF